MYVKPQKKCIAQWKDYHPELCKYSRATRECYNDIGASEYISRVQFASKPPPSTQVPSTTPGTTNQQQAMIATQNHWQPPPPLLTLPTQHTTDTHPAPSPTHYHCTPHPLSNISPPIRLPFHCTLIPHHSMLSLIQPAHPQFLLNLFIRLKHPHSHSRHTILLFPASSSHLNPTLHTSIPRMGTSDRHKGTQLRMTIIFFLWKWCTMYNNNWTTWWRWWVQLQLPGANQLILNNKLQHPGTQHKETKAQRTIDIWIGK